MPSKNLYQTDVKTQTLNPIWNQTFVMCGPEMNSFYFLFGLHFISYELFCDPVLNDSFYMLFEEAELFIIG